jgi:hypothetical protein
MRETPISPMSPRLLLRRGQLVALHDKPRQHFHIPSDFVVMPWVLHDDLDISVGYSHGVSSADET